MCQKLQSEQHPTDLFLLLGGPEGLVELRQGGRAHKPRAAGAHSFIWAVIV